MRRNRELQRSITILTLGFIFIWAVMILAQPITVRAQSDGTDADQGCTVSARALKVRAGPNAQFDVVAPLVRGDSFSPVVRIENAAWLFGTSDDGNGWVTAESLACDLEIEELPVMDFPLEPCAVDLDGSADAESDNSGSALSKSGATSEAGETTSSSATGPGGVTLVSPLDDVIGGRETFEWQSSGALESGQAYEMVFWESGQDPLTAGFAVAGAKPASEITVNLDKAVQFVPQLESGTDYLWGVLLVQQAPYARLKLLGGGHEFTFLAASTTSSGGDSGSGPLPGTGGK